MSRIPWFEIQYPKNETVSGVFIDTKGMVFKYDYPYYRHADHWSPSERLKQANQIGSLDAKSFEYLTSLVNKLDVLYKPSRTNKIYQGGLDNYDYYYYNYSNSYDENKTGLVRMPSLPYFTHVKHLQASDNNTSSSSNGNHTRNIGNGENIIEQLILFLNQVSDNAKRVNFKSTQLGGDVEIKVEDCFACGYIWSLDYDQKMLQKLNDDVECPEVPGLVGAPCERIIKFRSLARGQTTIVGYYFRPSDLTKDESSKGKPTKWIITTS